MKQLINKIKSAYYGTIGLLNQKEAASEYRVLADDLFGTIYHDKGYNEAHWSPVRKGATSWRKYVDNSMIAPCKDYIRLYATCENGDIKTCGISTMDKVTAASGKVDVVARIRTCPHCWPAIWLYRNPDTNEYGAPEIDLSECFHAKGFTYQTVHTAYQLDKTGHGHTTRAFLNPLQWNTFTAEWDKRSVRLYINGVLTTEWDMRNDVIGEFNNPKCPLKLMLTAQLGGSSWPGEPTEDCECFMDVRSVTFYEAID